MGKPAVVGRARAPGGASRGGWRSATPPTTARRVVHLRARASSTFRGAPLSRGSMIATSSWPALCALRPARRRKSAGSRVITSAKKNFMPGGASEDSSIPRKSVSGYTGAGEFEPINKPKPRLGEIRRGPMDSDDVVDIDVFESFAESEATVQEATLQAVVEDDWPRLTGEAIAGAWREWREYVLTKLGIAALWLSGILVASTGLSHYVGRHFVNQALPWMSATVSQAANRPIRIGRCKGLWPTGLLGVGSLVDVGPLVIGPAEAERSIVEVAKVKLSLRPIASLLQFRIVVAAHLEGVQATLRQGDNSSWLGFPDDTIPISARPTISLPKRAGDADGSGGGGPKLALESVRVANGTASLHLAGDPDPRLLKRLNGTVNISNKGRLEIDATVNPVSRGVPPAERIVTMKSDTLPRNLRAEQTEAEVRSLAREVARGTDGGTIRAYISLVPPSADEDRKNVEEIKPNPPGFWPHHRNDLKVRIQLNNTSAAVVERTIPGLPLDVSAGRLDGELRLRCNDTDSWRFPEFGGQIRARGLNFHFFDSPDSFADTDADLVFEGKRLYLHGGKGHYGAVPLTASGDLDLCPGEKDMAKLRELRENGMDAPRPEVVQSGSGLSGEYRISAQVQRVDAHALRETLGVRPPPRPVAGALRGNLYVGGPLDFPIFTGNVETIPPLPEDLTRAEPGSEAALAEDAIRAGAADGAVGAYDCFAVKDARAVFTVDTWTQKLTLHEAEASPLAGGEGRASGTVRLDLNALSHPNAVNVEMEAEGFDPRSVVNSFAMKGAAASAARADEAKLASTSESETERWVAALPGGLKHLFASDGPLSGMVEQLASEQAVDAGAGKSANANTFGIPPALYDKIVPSSPGVAKATIVGPHAAPKVDATWAVEGADIAGDLSITRQRVSATVNAPAVEFKTVAETSYPPLEVALAARTIDESLAAGRPSFTAAEIDATLRSLDLAALVVAEDDLARLAPPDRLRLRLSGSVKVKGSVEGAGGATAASLPKVTPASRDAANKAADAFSLSGVDHAPSSPYVCSPDGKDDPVFKGKVNLDGFRVNQLQLAPRLAGEVDASLSAVNVNARGRADEHLRFRFDNPAAAPAASSSAPAATDAQEPPASAMSMSIRRGLLRAEVSGSDGRGVLDVAGLRLDDLELASLRGRVERAKINVDLREKLGAATLRVQQPRLSGVQGEVLDADASWNGRVVRLERAALDQRRSKYTLKGEHCLDDAVWASLPPPRPEPPVVLPSVEEHIAAEIVADGATDEAPARAMDVDVPSASRASVETVDLASRAASEDDVASVVDELVDELVAAAEGLEDAPVAMNAAIEETSTKKRPEFVRRLFSNVRRLFGGASTRAEAAATEAATADAATEEVTAPETPVVDVDERDIARVVEETIDSTVEEIAREVANVAAETEDAAVVEEDAAETDAAPAAAEETEASMNLSQMIPPNANNIVDDYREFMTDEPVASAEQDVAEEKPSSSNPLAGVMDRLTAIATKVKSFPEGNQSEESAAAAMDSNAVTEGDLESLVTEEPATPVEEMDPGAWRLMLAVPQADVEEMLPAVRLAAVLREGATPLEYTRAKDHFLHEVRKLAITASEELGRQLDQAAAVLAAEQRAAGRTAKIGADAANTDAPVQLPGLQDLKGRWRGVVEVKGGAGASIVSDSGSPASNITAVDFDVEGNEWQWGQYQVQSVQAQGNVDAVEGLHLRRLELKSDGAVVKLDGNLFGETQNAAFAVIDLPAQRLAPIIHHITSAASASAGAPPPPPPPLPTITGTLFVSGDIGGSPSSPTGSVRAHLSEGRIGSVKLGHANASAEVTPSRTARFHAEANPASSSKRNATITPGHLRLSGVLPLPDAEDRSVAVDWSVQDGGMHLVSALSAPSLGSAGPVEWQAGGADITLAVRGTLADPVYDGAAVITRAKIVSPLLQRPLYPVSANVRIQRNTLYADHFDAKCGPRGSIKIRGAVPVLQPRRGASGETWEGLVARADVQGGIRAEASGVEVRARAVYSGRLDADLVVKGTLLEPEIGGSLRLSKGTAFIQPNAAPSGGVSAASRPGSTSTGGFFGREARRSLAGFLQRASPPGTPAKGGKTADKDASALEQLPLRFRGLRLIVGPELSAVYPFVLNFGVGGEVEVNGAADPVLIRPSGAINFERGDINLVATQVRLSREHPNRAVFVPEHGLDPTLDVSLVGADIRALVQGKASNWTENLVITSGSGRAGAKAAAVVGGGTVGGKVVGGVGTGDQIVGPNDRDAAVAEAARIFEGQLTESLLEQDGQLAFSNLAASTVATLMPKIETGGQLGKARWRVTTAPSIPGLLSLDPSTDPFRNISQFSLGSDWELMLGDSLQATMSRKLKESEMQTTFALVYKLTDKLNMQLNSESSTATRLLFEFTTNARGK
jgi:hypothetical protein